MVSVLCSSHMKQCSKCREVKSLDGFYVTQRKWGPRLSSYCKSCMSDVTIDRQRKFKKDCIAYKGGKCQDCEFTGYEGVFDFHHLDPDQKDFEISRFRSMKFDDRAKSELDKCVLLCSNCHRIRHAVIKGLIGPKAGI